MNPYSPPQPEKFICSQCKAENERPGFIGQCVGTAVLFVMIALATHGLVTIAKQHGIVDKTGEHFWFEAELRRMIHGR